jgi:hypothetical protein
MEIYIVVLVIVGVIVLYICGKRIWELGYLSGMTAMEREFQKQKWH